MAGVTFTHPNLDIGTLNLRLPPTSVEWTFNMNTSVRDTYAGQVIQLLSVNIDRLTITGKFGKEGPHGRGDQRNYTTNDPLGVGLTQMTEFFRNYFSVASQGIDTASTGNYDQRSIKLTYEGALDVPVSDGKTEVWLVHPISFPSYKRSNQDFAPEWRVECEVVEPSLAVQVAAEHSALNQLRDSVGYRPNNEFSDPLGQFLPQDYHQRTEADQRALLAVATKEARGQIDDTFSHFQGMIPAYTEEDLQALLQMNGSLPLTPRLQKAVQTSNAQVNKAISPIILTK